MWPQTFRRITANLTDDSHKQTLIKNDLVSTKNLKLTLTSNHTTSIK
jgi:hypothetical protein